MEPQLTNLQHKAITEIGLYADGVDKSLTPFLEDDNKFTQMVGWAQSAIGNIRSQIGDVSNHIAFVTGHSSPLAKVLLDATSLPYKEKRDFDFFGNIGFYNFEGNIQGALQLFEKYPIFSPWGQIEELNREQRTTVHIHDDHSSGGHCGKARTISDGLVELNQITGINPQNKEIIYFIREDAADLPHTLYGLKDNNAFNLFETLAIAISEINRISSGQHLHYSVESDELIDNVALYWTYIPEEHWNKILKARELLTRLQNALNS